MSGFSVKMGGVIRKKRTELALSQEGLAALSGLSRSYIGEIERGEVEVSAVNLQRIANGLRLKMSELIRSFEESND